MEKTMKSSAIKTIVVQMTADNVQEFDIDTAVLMILLWRLLLVLSKRLRPKSMALYVP